MPMPKKTNRFDELRATLKATEAARDSARLTVDSLTDQRNRLQSDFNELADERDRLLKVLRSVENARDAAQAEVESLHTTREMLTKRIDWLEDHQKEDSDPKLSATITTDDSKKEK